ncbi:MAG TPA: twin-arginine translocation signal domain-containing protein [Afifellaceae bacterium]|nr:twin-arginine translocation signal domain-containing protein [Afifellaceae bacterium]
MSKKPSNTGQPSKTHARAIDRRSFLAAAPAAGLAVGAVAMVGEGETPPGADPDRHLQYRETPHIQAYYRRARY